MLWVSCFASVSPTGRSWDRSTGLLRRLRRIQPSQKARPKSAAAPRTAPTPMPALAPVDRLFVEGEAVFVAAVGIPVLDVVVMSVAGDVAAERDGSDGVGGKIEGGVGGGSVIPPDIAASRFAMPGVGRLKNACGLYCQTKEA